VINPDSELLGAYSGAHPCPKRRKSLFFQEVQKALFPESI
jgi:hypothetical protein